MLKSLSEIMLCVYLWYVWMGVVYYDVRTKVFIKSMR